MQRLPGKGDNMIGVTTAMLHKLEKDGLTLEGRALILTSEIGMLAKLVNYSTRFQTERAAHLADLRLAMGDAMVQLEMMCHDLGEHPEYIKQLGIDHTLERFYDFQKRGWK